MNQNLRDNWLVSWGYSCERENRIELWHLVDHHFLERVQNDFLSAQFASDNSISSRRRKNVSRISENGSAVGKDEDRDKCYCQTLGVLTSQLDEKQVLKKPIKRFVVF